MSGLFMSKKIFFAFLISILFVSCNFQNSIGYYYDYWSGTTQTGIEEILTPYTVLSGVQNISAENGFLEISLFVINPRGYDVLSSYDGNNPPRFKLINSNNDTVSEGSVIEQSPTMIKCSFPLDDNYEGQTLFLDGFLSPQNIDSFVTSNSYEELEQSIRQNHPELVYKKKFIQNTPPDPVTNFKVTEDTLLYNGKNLHYFNFYIPNQTLNKNKNCGYLISTYETNEETKKISKIDEEIVYLSDNLNNKNNGKFFYYSKKQENNKQYGYTVKVLGSRKLISDVFSTPNAPGNPGIEEPKIEFSNTTKESDEGDKEVYTINTPVSTKTQLSIIKETGIEYECYLDGVKKNENSFDVNIGEHKLKLVLKKDKFQDTTYEKIIKLQGTLSDDIEFTYGNGGGKKLSETEEYDGNTYKKYQFSYMQSDYLYLLPPEGVKFNSLKVNGTTVNILRLSPDEYYKIETNISKENYKDKNVTLYIKPVIKPIKLTFKNDSGNIRNITYAACNGFDCNDNTFHLRGMMYLNTNLFWYWDQSDSDNYNSVYKNGSFHEIRDTFNYDFSIICTSTKDNLCMSFNKVRRQIGSGNDEQFGSIENQNIPLPFVKKGDPEDGLYGSTSSINRGWICVTKKIVGNHGWWIRVAVYLNAEEVDE